MDLLKNYKVKSSHFHILLCEKIIFPLSLGKYDDLVPQLIIFFPWKVEIIFLNTKGCGNAPLFSMFVLYYIIE